MEHEMYYYYAINNWQPEVHLLLRQRCRVLFVKRAATFTLRCTYGIRRVGATNVATITGENYGICQMKVRSHRSSKSCLLTRHLLPENSDSDRSTDRPAVWSGKALKTNCPAHFSGSDCTLDSGEQAPLLRCLLFGLLGSYRTVTWGAATARTIGRYGTSEGFIALSGFRFSFVYSLEQSPESTIDPTRNHSYYRTIRINDKRLRQTCAYR